MTKYIDAEALCELARGHVAGTVDCNDIMRFPAADVAEVVHGHYVVDDLDASSCSNCGGDYLDCTDPYCPRCGAKMDREKEDV